MKPGSYISSSVIPDIKYTSIDFQTYLDGLINNILVAMLVFFAFIACMYIFFLGIQYSIYFLKYLKVSKPEKQKVIQQHTVENLVILEKYQNNI